MHAPVFDTVCPVFLLGFALTTLPELPTVAQRDGVEVLLSERRAQCKLVDGLRQSMLLGNWFKGECPRLMRKALLEGLSSLTDVLPISGQGVSD